jgi:TonB-dependent receptor
MKIPKFNREREGKMKIIDRKDSRAIKLLYASAFALGAAFAAPPALAQDTGADAAASEDGDNLIIVTGYRGSLKRAIEVKRQETTIVDAIGAEDIADFPDLNLAESLQRVPGVQIDRDGGEGRSINVRGLSSDFVRVQINGMEALATTGGRDGRANRNRQFDFNVFASELFNSIKVSKSQEAAADEGSLGATVGLQTARPFDYSGFTLALGGQASYNDLSQETDPRGTMLISNRWLDGRLGALFSVAYSSRNTFEEGSSSGRFRVPADDGCVGPNFVNSTRCYQSVGTITDASGATLTGSAAAVAAANGSHPRIPRYGRISYDRERLGMTGSIQFDLTPETRITFDSLYAELDQERTEEFLEVISFARETSTVGLRAVDLVSGRVDGERNLVQGTFNDVDIRAEQRIDVLETEFTQNTLLLDHDFSSRLRMSALVGVSRAIGRNPQQTTISLERYDVDGYSYDYSDPNLPKFDYNFDVNDPANWVFSSSTAAGDASLIRLRPNKTLNTYETARFDLEFDLTPDVTLSAGASRKKFGFDVKEVRRASEGVPASVLAELTARGIPQSEYTTVVTDFGRNLDLPAGTPTSWIVPDLNALNNLIGFDCNCVNDFGDFTLRRQDGETRSAYETSNGIFAQVDWNTEIFNMPVRGNLGVRYVETELESTGILSGAEESASHKYEDTLPSLNVVVEPISDVLVRFAASKVLARPSLNALTPGGSIDASPPGLSLNSGNPYLDPVRANTYDVSIEWYPYEEALFAVALFRKDIDSFIQRLRTNVPYSQTGFPLDLLPTGVSPSDEFAVTTFLNTPGGDLTGIEVTLQTPFSFLDDTAFEGFGGLLNVTKIESEVDYITNVTTGATTTQPLVGQSPTSASATLYFERGPFEARVSGTYREEYLTLVPAQSGNDVEGKADQFNLDMSASYDLNERLSFSLEAINLTDQADERWINSVRRNSNNYEVTGREFVVGMRYKY